LGYYRGWKFSFAKIFFYEEAEKLGHSNFIYEGDRLKDINLNTVYDLIEKMKNEFMPIGRAANKDFYEYLIFWKRNKKILKENEF